MQCRRQFLQQQHVASLLCSCKCLDDGKLLHQRIREIGQESDTFLGNHLIKMYGELGSLHGARSAFEKIQNTNVFSWSILLAAYAHSGSIHQAKTLFDKMPSRNAISWTTMLVAVAKHGTTGEIKQLFDESPERDAVAWNALISAFDKKGDPLRALQMFWMMLLDGIRPNEVSFVSVLEACANLCHVSALIEGRTVHRWIKEARLQDKLKLSNALVHMYGRQGCLLQAKSCFENMKEWNVVSWNTMMLAFISNDLPDKATELFRRMTYSHFQIDQVTLITAAEACGILQDTQTATMVNSKCKENKLEHDVKVTTALVNMFGRCNLLEEAKQVFRSLRSHDVILWTAMLTAYAHTGHHRTAIHFLKRMDVEGIRPNNVTLICVFEICGNISALSEGKTLHSSIVCSAQLGRDSESKLWNSILSMYAKCGSLTSAISVFSEMPNLDVVSWNGLFAAFGENKQTKLVLELYSRMQLDGMTPNVTTFTSILAACSRVGLLDDGCRCFGWMEEDYNIKAGVDHYRCMIDLLGRAGRIEEAEGLASYGRLNRDDISWNTLLAACRLHEATDLGVRAAKRLALVDPDNSATYVVLSGMYSVGDGRVTTYNTTLINPKRGSNEHISYFLGIC